jgi:copper chaperone
MEAIEIGIDGMHCDGCVKRVRGALEKISGVSVREVRVGHAAIEAADPATGELAVGALERMGFEARVKKGDRAA